MKRKVLSFDFGASSGRAIIFEYDDGKLDWHEISRFATRQSEYNGALWWDYNHIFDFVDKAVATAVSEGVESVGIDTWGCDFALVDGDKVVVPPLYYRDRHIFGAAEKASDKMSFEWLYSKTGIQKMDINTVYRFDVLDNLSPGWRTAGGHALLMADLVAWHLTGKMRTELTNASTTGMLSPYTREFDDEILGALRLKKEFFAPLIYPGEIYGRIVSTDIPLIAVCTHDTASAVASVPADKDKFAYVSSGTWSLFGTERSRPETSPEAMAMNFTNEIGFGGSIRLLKNIMGLWILQEFRRNLAGKGKKIEFPEMAALARGARCEGIINPDDAMFMSHGDIAAAVDAYMSATGQPLPSDDAQRLRLIYESLALAYKNTLQKLEKLTGESYDVLHIVGGGSRDEFLSQLTADTTGRTVVTGPTEATATGNALVQLMALGEISDLAAARAIVKANVKTKLYVANDDSPLNEKFTLFQQLTEDK